MFKVNNKNSRIRKIIMMMMMMMMMMMIIIIIIVIVIPSFSVDFHITITI